MEEEIKKDTRTSCGEISEEKEDYGSNGYVPNDIDIYPITIRQQEVLRNIFELLEIPKNCLLFGHTKIIISTGDFTADMIKPLMEEHKEIK